MSSELTARWHALAISSAFGKSAALQTPSFLTIGGLLRETDDDSLLKQCLYALEVCLESYVDSRNQLICGIITCLTDILCTNTPSDLIVDLLFWIGIGICQLQISGLFESGLLLIQSIVELFAARQVTGAQLAKSLSMSQFNLGILIHGVHESEGLNFRDHFALSVSVVLSNGIHDASFKALSIHILSRMIVLFGDQQGASPVASTMGFFVSIFPSVVGIEDRLISMGIFIDQDEPDHENAVLDAFADATISQTEDELFLQVYFMYNFAELCKTESEILRVYQFLTAIAKKTQAVLQKWYVLC